MKVQLSVLLSLFWWGFLVLGGYLVKCCCCGSLRSQQWEVISWVAWAISMEHLKYLGRDLELYYLELQVQEVAFVIVLLERQSGNKNFLGYDSWSVLTEIPTEEESRNVIIVMCSWVEVVKGGIQLSFNLLVKCFVALVISFSILVKQVWFNLPTCWSNKHLVLYVIHGK